MTRRRFLEGVSGGLVIPGVVSSLLSAATGPANATPPLSMPALLLGDSQPAKPAQLIRLATDHVRLDLTDERPPRILQITDTHFGRPTDADRTKDQRTRTLIQQLVEQHQPHLVFHTGDFINNDVPQATYGEIGFMNDLPCPWALSFGNHDHPRTSPSGISLDEFASRLENCATGYANTSGGKEFAFRIDLHGKDKQPALTIFSFNCGSDKPNMHVSPGQTEWFARQIEADLKAGRTHPAVVMMHIPVKDFHDVFEAKAAVGRRGETVCFESDTGDVFARFRESKRIRGIFVGHDHVNDYVGQRDGVSVVYGRVTGWAGYGDWQRGGRLLDVSSSDRSLTTRVVLPADANERDEWSATLRPSRI